MKLKSSLRIIEGIRSGQQGQDARMIGEFLKMARWKCQIKDVTVKSKKPKQDFLRFLLKSESQFLHISAHGGETELQLEDPKDTKIGIADIKSYCQRKGMTRHPLKERFVTLSACGHISNAFVQELNKVTAVTAVISPLTPVHFSESALFSTLFYFALAQFPKLSSLSIDQTDDTETTTEGRIAQYIDSFQKAKLAYLTVGGTGAHRLDYWWSGAHYSLH